MYAIRSYYAASHIGLECALKTQPNITLISEEVAEKKQTLGEVVDYMAGIVSNRAADGNNFGVALIPEGLIEFIPEMKVLISELNVLLAEVITSYSIHYTKLYDML